MNDYCIYIHQNIYNGKVYIGQTNNVKRRWQGNGCQYQHTPRFWSAIKHYGWNAFIHKILEDNLTPEEANIKEKYYIEYYDAINPDKGYNLALGGNRGSYWQTKKGRKQQSERRKQYYAEHPELKNRLAEYRKQHPEMDKIHSEFMKTHYQESPLYKINQDRKKQVRCIETGEIFDTLTNAAEFYKVSVSNLSAHLNHPNKRKSCGQLNGQKLHWQFIDYERRDKIAHQRSY